MVRYVGNVARLAETAASLIFPRVTTLYIRTRATRRDKLEIDARPQPDSTLHLDVTAADSSDAPNDTRAFSAINKKFFSTTLRESAPVP